MAVTTTTLCSGSPSATLPQIFLSHRPGEFRQSQIHGSMNLALAFCGLVHGSTCSVWWVWCRSWCLDGLGQLYCYRHNQRTGYVLPFLFLTVECSAFTKFANEVQLDHYVHMQQHSETFQAQASKAWRRIKQAGHGMHFLIPHICIYVEWMQQACRRTKALSSCINTESQ